MEYEQSSMKKIIPPEISTPTQHEIDFDKVWTLKDVKLIMECLYIIIYDNHERFDDIKHLLKDVE